MTNKQNLINLFQSVLEVAERAEREVSSIKDSVELSSEGKRIALERVKDEAAPTLTQYREQAIALIEKVIAQKDKEIYENTTSKLSDGGYQVGLANAIKMFETPEALTAESGQQLIDYYKNDVNAINLFRGILAKNPSSELAISWTDKMPRDLSKRTQKVLNDLYRGVAEKLNATMLAGTNADSYIIVGWIEFLTTRLDDNFNIIE